jgi:hypothetical protein
MRASTALVLLAALLCCCVNVEEDDTPTIEYQCWDGTIVPDLGDCPPTTTQRTTTTAPTTTTTTTTQPCTWDARTCRMHCSKMCGKRPLDFCEINASTCGCDYVCGTTTTEASTTTTTLPERWLTESEIDEAISWGEKNRFNQELMLTEYATPNYTVGYEHVITYTPYLNLALAAGAKAREYQQLSDEEVDAIVTNSELTFKVKLYGNSQSFNDDIKAVMKLRNEVIYPIRAKPDEEPETTAYWPKSPAYFAVNTYVFKDYGRVRDRTIRIVVIRNTREDSFEIDMGDYK